MTLLLAVLLAVAQDDVAAAVRKVYDAQLKALEAEDPKAFEATNHPKNPNLQATVESLPDLFKNYDLKYEVKSFRFVAADADYAYVRVVQVTSKVAGPDFNNNTVDGLHVFRKDGAAWKFWTTALLEVKFHD